MTDTLRAALYSIPADDRETWVTIAMAIKSDRGEAGFTMWDTWSRQSDRYKSADARAVWRSCKPTGGITIATLYHLAKENGWDGQAPVMPQASPEERKRRAEQSTREQKERKERAAMAALGAKILMDTAGYDHHPYLTGKKFPSYKGLIAKMDWPQHTDYATVCAGALLIPMRHSRTGHIQSVQGIDAHGVKKFLQGSVVKGSVFRLGPPRASTVWYCEGYATGLSVQAALARLFRNDQVAVCFSAHNLPQVAQQSGFVVTDHDLYTCTVEGCKHRWDGPWGETECPACGSDRIVAPAGEKYARQTGLPFWMPPEQGDANDFHQTYGAKALAEELRKALNG